MSVNGGSLTEPNLRLATLDVMNDAQIKGPLLGATFRGKVDFKTQTVDIGGTYVPLSGINSAIGVIPIIGQLLAGPKGEGIFAFTFLVQGPIAQPQITVNPFSGLLPGILRETMQMAPETYRISPRDERAVPKVQKPEAARSSSVAQPVPSSAPPGKAAPPKVQPEVLGDWTAGVRPEKKQ